MSGEVEKYIDHLERVILIEDPTELVTGENPAVLLERPKLVVQINLPLTEYADWKVRYSLHTDMLLNFLKALRAMTERVQKDLYIQARMPTKQQYEKLENSVVYNFFTKTMYHRRALTETQRRVVGKISNPQDKKNLLEMLVPKGLLHSEADAMEYKNMDFTPETIIKGLEDIRVVWFQAQWLVKLWKHYAGAAEVHSPNALLPLLGGVNKFNIGSNNLPGGMLITAGTRIRKNFEVEAEKKHQSGFIGPVLDEQALAVFDRFPA